MNSTKRPVLWTAALSLALSSAAHANLHTQTDVTIGSCQAEKFTSIKIVRSRVVGEEGGALPVASYSLVVEEVERDRQAGGIFLNSVTSIVDSSNAELTQWVEAQRGVIELRLDFMGTQPENHSRVALRFEEQNPKDRSYLVSLEKLGNSTLTKAEGSDPFTPPPEADTNYAYDRLSSRWKTYVEPFLTEKDEGKLTCQLFVDLNKIP